LVLTELGALRSACWSGSKSSDRSSRATACIAKRLQLSNVVDRLAKAEVIQFLWQGLVINAVGMFLSLLGVEAIAAALLAKSLTQVQGLAIYNNNQLIESLDILVVQANVNTIFAQFIGIIISAWLISRISYHS
jgi:hypothetical protein